MYRICVYATAGDAAFEATIPLLRNGAFMRRRGLENRLHVHFMLGANRLSRAYHDQLRELGYQVHDNEPDMAPVLARFPNIAQMPTYFAYCYLRWPILERLIDRGIIDLPVVGVDGDVVFTAPFDEITHDIAGKTFILEGNPCFTAISDMEWLRAYGNELERLDRDPAAFNADAAQIKRLPPRDDRQYCNASWYPLPIRHDQDLLQFLVAAGRLPQSQASEIFQSRFYWVQNPLFPAEWIAEQCGRDAVRSIIERDGRIAIAGKQLAFVHYQNDFALYCHAWQRLHDMGLGFLAPGLRYSSSTGAPTKLGRLLYGGLRRMDRGRKHARSAVYDQTLRTNRQTGNLYVTDMISALLSP